jgi:(S)-sulfolactate dehydrogenase
LTKIVISEFMDEEAVAYLAASHDVQFDPTLVDSPPRLAMASMNADALIVRNRTRVDSSLITRARRLRCVGRLGVGLDNIDTKACRSRAIDVFAATGANDVAVAEYVLGTMLVLLRRAYGATQAVMAGTWPRLALIGREAHGRRIGLVGFGATAREIAKRAAAFGMEVQAFDPHLPSFHEAWKLAAYVDLTTLLATSDVVSVHVPLTDATCNLIGRKEFAQMRRDAIFINTARGGVVEETALADALLEKRIAGAAMDVFEEEPLPAAQGRIFASLDNLILTPHIAGLTEESNVRVSWMVARRIAEALSHPIQVATQ